MSAPQLKVHFDFAPAPPAYSPPPAYAAHSFGHTDMSFAQKEHLASMAETKLGYLVSQKRREPSLRRVLLHAGFLERVLDSIDAHSPETYDDDDDDEPMIEDMSATAVAQATPSYELYQSSLGTIVEIDEMEVDDQEEEEEDEDMPPLRRTISHRPGSPSLSDEDEADLLEEDSDEELPSPPPTYYNTSPGHPLFSLFEVREKARRDELTHHYKIDHNDQDNVFLMSHNLAVAA